MNNYYIKYLKYKIKYLNLKDQVGNGRIISTEEIIGNMLELYNMVSTKYTEVYLTGSMALYFLAHNFGVELDEDYPLPNDVDFVVYNNGKLLIEEKNIISYKREQSTAERSVTMKSDTTENYFKSFDIIASKLYKNHHVVLYNGQNINVLDLTSIKDEYIDDINPINSKKLELIEKLDKIDLKVHQTKKKSVHKRRFLEDSDDDIPKVRRTSRNLSNLFDLAQPVTNNTTEESTKEMHLNYSDETMSPLKPKRFSFIDM